MTHHSLLFTVAEKKNVNHVSLKYATDGACTWVFEPGWVQLMLYFHFVVTMLY